MLQKLLKSLEKAPIVKKGEYDYFVHPVTDGIPLTEPEVLSEIAKTVKNVSNMDVDKIVCMEAMGIHLATALSLETGLPFVVVRKRQYGLPGEVAVHQTTGYSQGELYINGINSGDKLLVIDDVVSTGGTMLAVLNALQKMDVDIVDVIAVIEKGQGKEMLEKETGLNIRALVKVDVIDGKVSAESLL
ncbi:hypoxanthine/guanine phosphoribosyltransferase [Methanobacterium alcaliphilum]|uniref:hypoxanthine/guanine phosphoribosyltransferase n=1 Tax=Methanobacterium alcaliphilum TaxID=392018 RepID=UPI00200AD292|nr:hypoxanthine/guanine phosphoribosyltransferase [Methanobacterium alcaliphilum]MCK9151017.1 hypoxanthine/guanine phosphoribosyltransferase [Methanobacterium alcaliphilum]